MCINKHIRLNMEHRHKLFKQLPDMVEHLIYEFNPEHRLQMRKVMQEVASLTCGTCVECGESLVYTLNTNAFYEYRKYGKPFKPCIGTVCQSCDERDYYEAMEEQFGGHMAEYDIDEYDIE